MLRNDRIIGEGGNWLRSLSFYTCKSCGKTWKRAAKKGPEEGDPQYTEYQTEWQIQRLAHEDINHREQAAKWLGEHGSVSAVEALIACLADRKMRCAGSRIEAALALKKIGDQRAIQPLIAAATDTGRCWQINSL